MSPRVKLVKQRKKQVAPEKQEVICEVIDKLDRDGFICEVQYPDWLTNVVLVKKASGKWRVCINFWILIRYVLRIATLFLGLTISWISRLDISYITCLMHSQAIIRFL